MLLPWGLCLQVKSLTLAASQKPTLLTWAKTQGQSPQSHTRRDHSSAERECWRAHWAEAMSSRAGAQRVHILDDCCYHSRYRAEGVTRGKSSWNLAKCCIKQGLERQLRRLDRLGDAGRDNAHVAGAQRSRRMAGGVKLRIHQVLIKQDIFKKIEIHQFFTSLPSPSPTPFSLQVAVGYKALANLSCHGLKALPNKFIMLPHSSVQPVVIPVSF